MNSNSSSQTPDAVPAGPFHVELDRRDGAVVLVVSGEIDLVSEPELSGRISDAMAEQPPLMVVDLSGVSFIASCGLAALMRTQQQAQAQRTEVRVVATDRTVSRPLEATGLLELLAVYDSREAALHSEPNTGET